MITAFLAGKAIPGLVSIGVLIYLYVCRRRLRHQLSTHKRRIKCMEEKLKRLQSELQQQLAELTKLAIKVEKQIDLIGVMLGGDQMEFDVLKNMISDICE